MLYKGLKKMPDEQSNNCKSVKVLAYFLPQFHAIPENDEWWGDGFTEWTTIRKENNISENLQPLNNNYYNLLDEKTVIWQTELAKEYGVYGFVYYHYYFCGKKLLEKPAENLLKNKKIDQKFCFCWANHDWNRSWEGVKTILVKQEYGREEDWRQHFDYLLPFFKDERYIKVDGKPMFVIFEDFRERESIYKYFNEYARNNGLEGIFFVQSTQKITRSNLKRLSEHTDAIVLREPGVSFNSFDICGGCIRRLRKSLSFLYMPFKLRVFKGDREVKKTVHNAKAFCKKVHENGIKCWLGAYSGWDNTSRHGIRGYKMTRISDIKYIWYLVELRRTAESENIEFIFFNAWNEWAEAMILEPDTLNKYRFLEGIKQVFAK
jgi:hypothetical protein